MTLLAWSLPFWGLITLIMVLQTTECANNLRDSNKISFRELFSMPLRFVDLTGLYYEQVTMVLGASSTQTSVGTSVNMLPDLSSNSIIVGSYPDLNWGIQCDASNSCTNKGVIHTCTRLTASAQCVYISTFLRFRNQSLPSGTSPLQIEMMTTQDNWFPKTEGVLGLGPQSPLWTYMNNEYDTGKDTIDISLFYRANKLDSLISLANDNFKNAVLVINGKGIAVDPFFLNYPTSTSSNWIMKTINFTKMVDGKIIESAENVCLANSINATIATSIYPEIKRSVFTQLCGNPNSCTKDNSNMDNIYRWSFTLYNESDQDSRFKIELKPEEIVNFDSNGNAVLLVHDLGDLKYSSICQGATLAFGRYFLADREVVIRYNKRDGSFMIGFHSFEPSLLFLIILLVLAAVVFIVFIVICVYQILEKAKKHLKNTGDNEGIDREKLAQN